LLVGQAPASWRHGERQQLTRAAVGAGERFDGLLDHERSRTSIDPGWRVQIRPDALEAERDLAGSGDADHDERIARWHTAQVLRLERLRRARRPVHGGRGCGLSRLGRLVRLDRKVSAQRGAPEVGARREDGARWVSGQLVGEGADDLAMGWVSVDPGADLV